MTSEFLYPIVVCVSSITTFLTPYLIRWSDPLAGTIHRIAPKGLIAALEVYVSHVRRLGETDGKPAGARLLRRLLLRLLVDVAFITAVFVSVRIVRPNVAGSLALLPDWLGGERTVLWGAALVLSLPILVATFQTLRALAAVLAVMSVPGRRSQGQAGTIRTIISTTVVLAGSVGLALLVLLLSSAILPPWPVLTALILVLAGAAAFAWRPVARLYERASLVFESSTGPAIVPHGDLPPPLHDLQGEMDLEKVAIGAGAPAVGRRIRELEVRSRTGASVVAIERGGQRIVNPSPDEELQAGDAVFLLGDGSQRRSARCLLASGGAPRDPVSMVSGAT